jgi:DNA adenine methylase
MEVKRHGDTRARMARSSSRRPPAAAARVGAQPFLKWAGGKWAIAPEIAKLLPRDAKQRVYREPFLGGGAMFFYLEPERAFLSDTLADLITAYEVVRESVEPLIKRLEKLRASHSKDQFYSVRDRFNDKESGASRLERAAWLIYLNKTCYNGLFRTNKSGGFNVPMGAYKTCNPVDPPRIRLSSAMLTHAKLTKAPFEDLLVTARAGEVVYLDPPYVPLSKTSNFSAYADGEFGHDDQVRLASVFRELDSRGCLLALSNSDTPVVRGLYAGFDLTPIVAPRNISSKTTTRAPTTELLVRNVKRYPR